MSASGSSHVFKFAEETVQGTLPTVFDTQELRILGGGDFAQDQAALVSSELTSDRQIKSSTLGTPKPSWSPSVEWSFGSFDKLIEGAMQNTWTGNGYVADLTVDVATNVLTTDGGTVWSSYDFADGDVITVTGLTVSAEDKSYLIASGSATAAIVITDLSGGAVSLTTEADAVLTVIAGRLSIVIDASANGLAVDATGLTITAASDVWTESTLDLRFNDLIYISGFSNAGNNGYHKIDSVTGTVLTVTDDSTLVTETISTGNVEVANNTAFINVGKSTKSYSVVSGYTDIEEYRYLTGAQVSGMSLNFSIDSIVSGDFSFLGTYLSSWSSTDPADSTEVASTTPVFNSFRGYASLGDTVPACMTDFSLSLDNGSEGLQCLFTRELDSIVHGRSNVTGSLSAYFDDPTVSNAYSDEEYLDIFISMVDNEGRSLSTGIKNAQLQGDTFDISEVTVSESLDFQSLGIDTTYTNLYFINSRGLPA